MYSECTDWANGEIMVTEELLFHTLKEDVLFSQIVDELEQSFDHFVLQNRKKYLNFIQ